MINKYLMVQGAGRSGDRRQLMGGGASQLRKENTRNSHLPLLPNINEDEEEDEDKDEDKNENEDKNEDPKQE